MPIYLLKFTICLATLYFFYKVCLENENMHTFKRIYLLASLVAALLIPALVFNEYVEVLPNTYVTAQEYSISQATTGPIGIPQALEKDALDIEPILWTVYFIGVLFFGLKFLKNLIQIIQRIRTNPKQKWEQFIHVLLRHQLPPHTFLSYIFLNQQKFEAKEIPEEVLLHEQTHARQKHSYDILFVEFLQVVFWINPFIYFIKKAIKLNHEFLADQAVLNKNVSKVHYQNTLLSYLSEDNKHHQSPLVNPINYSSIKKRFTIMKRHTSKKAIVLRSILVLPLITILLVGFSQTNTIEVQKEYPSVINLSTLEGNEPTDYQIPNDKRANTQTLSNHDSLDNIQELITLITVNINRKGQLLVQDDLVEIDNLESYLTKINPDLSTEERQKIVRSFIIVEPETPKHSIEKVNKLLMAYGTATIDIKKLFPPDYTKPQNGITTKELAEYNKLAKHYNSESRNKMKIYKKDVERLEYLFSKMSKKQKATAEPFPDFPEPPPVPKAPKAPTEREEALHTIETIIANQDPYDVVNTGIRINQKEQKIVFPDNSRVYIHNSGTSTNIENGLEKYVTSIDLKNAQFYFEGEKISSKKGMEIIKNKKDIKVETIPYTNKQPEVRIYKSDSEGTIPPPPPPHAPKVLNGEASDIPAPPAPPKPITPLDHIISMAKKDAIFLFEGNEISSDEAIELIRDNKDLNIDSRTAKGKKPVVKISASPIPH